MVNRCLCPAKRLQHFRPCYGSGQSEYFSELLCFPLISLFFVSENIKSLYPKLFGDVAKPDM